MYFYKETNKTKKIEEDSNKKISNFLNILNEKGFLKEIISLGIVGPCSRNQGFYINKKVRSDLDFYLISKRFNLVIANKIKQIFYEIFIDKEMNSLHYMAPTILNRPDLMFFEYVNSGKVLYGKKIKNIQISEISKLEVLRNIIFREAHFLKLFNLIDGHLVLKKGITKEELSYGYSKIIFAIGEVFLILDETYVADNLKRNELIKYNKYARKLEGFIYEHKKMNKFRYSGSNIDVDKLFINAFYFIEKTYDLVFNKFNFVNIKEIKTSRLRYLWNQLFFTLNYFKRTKRINLIFIEPFIKLTLLNFNLVKKINKGEKIESRLFEDILIYWKIAPWFYYKI